ncbi:hypothetical protein DOTSEDRAFT_78513 [Dothistroma septosporum NZE10]|uniref:Uncharacterized protein n=1 Tax=Dothistroma septosporum (strain NZE10 / CBS 128990) TaxID=675120 RepID=N1PUQ6_DOTSN|nr:hypothetical protein DOTSEDRAFT_78513 [Dothistroma septosporum NZE10]
MALATRDVNSRSPHFFHPTSRIAVRRASPYMEISSDENPSPPPRKLTPPSKRLLAPPQASRAKTTPVRPSRLPRSRVPSPSTIPRAMAKETATPRNLFMDKPLPARPIASFSNVASPSKDSRCLMDASEKPLQIALGDTRYEYPALTPRSVSTPQQHSSTAVRPPKATPSSIPRRVSATAGMVAAASEMTKVFTGNGPRDSKMSTASSNPSFVSASESKPVDARAEGDHCAVLAAAQAQYARPTLGTFEAADDSCDLSPLTQPNRKESLRARISHGSLKPAAKGSMEKITGFADFTKESMPPTPESNPASSRSPSSFSQPRQFSSAKSLRKPSPPSTSDETPSRLPMCQATAVDHKAQAVAKSPSLETRSKISPHTFKLLDQGIRRRELQQLQRADTNASTASDVSAISRVQQTADAIQGKQVHLTTPDTTTARSVSPGSDTATPVSRMPSLSRSLRSLDEDGIPKIWGESKSKCARAPPSCSPFTGPLQTIHSQATLPLASGTSSSTLVNDAPHDIPPLNAFPIPRSAAHTHNSLRAEPSAPAAIHQPLDSQDSGKDVDRQLRRTLSKLNGEGSPPKTDIDEEGMHSMFHGMRFRRSVAADTPETSSICAEAAAAELFLQREHQEPRTSRVTFSDLPDRDSIQPETRAPRPPTPTIQANHVPTASKWSASTPSALGTSAGSESLPTPTAIIPDIPPKDPNRSIGYISSDDGGNGPTGKRATLQSVGHSSRNSSPTLGQGKYPKGSVSNARAHIAERTANFARSTASAESKKTNKSPRASAAHSVTTNEDQRGRDSLNESSGPRSTDKVPSQPPRSRSKSRLVFDKLHGILKRDKGKVQHSPPPPLPTPSVPLEDLRKAAPSPVVPVSRNDSRRVRTPKNLSKSPSWPQSKRDSRTTVASIASGAILGEGDARDSESSDQSSSVKSLVDKVMKKADLESNPERKHRMLTFAMSLLESVQATAQAAIFAEKAKNAAVEAEFWYYKALKGSNMMEALASGLVASSTRH